MCRIRKNQLDATGIDVIRLNQHDSGIIMAIVKRTDYVNNCMWSMSVCVGCSRAEMGDTSCVHCVKVGI